MHILYAVSLSIKNQTFFNSNLSFSAELKMLSFEHTKMFNSEVKKKP